MFFFFSIKEVEAKFQNSFNVGTFFDQIERVVQAYKTLSKISSIVEARLNNTGTKISSIWSVRNIDKGKNSKYAVDYLLNADFKVVAKSDFGVDISTEYVLFIL